LAEFRNPPRHYAPVYAWNWNGPVTREKTDAQLAEMAAQGVRILYIIPEPKGFRPATFATQMEPDYLTPAYFEEYKYTFEKARELGMECWLYDEGGWPSGGACGRVLLEYPHLARKSLGTREVEYAIGACYIKSGPDVIAAFVDTERPINEGYCFPLNCTVTEYFIQPHLFERPAIPDYPDLLLPESTQRFIEMTHEQYKPYLGEMFGDLITAVFTDEPNYPRPIPMRQDLLDAFQAEYGESIIPALPAMLGKCRPSHHEGELIANWFDLCSRWFCDHYLKAEKKWCNDHGMAFTGHMDKDDEPGCLRISGNAHSMRALRCLDIPGIDVIWRQIYPGEYRKEEGLPPSSINGFFPRHASSAAYQMGNRWAMTESFGVYGSGLTYDLMRYVTNFQAVRGVSIMNSMLYTYHRHGHLLVGEQPNFDNVQPYYHYLFDYNRFAERVTYLTTLGDRVCDTALYYPARDISVDVNVAEPHMPVAEGAVYDRLGRAMEDAGIDFDIIDDDFLRDAVGHDAGKLCMGLAGYTKIYVPKCQYMPEASKKALERFAAAGGQVYYDEIPEPEPAVELKTGYHGIRLMKRVSDRGDMILIFNENETSADVSLHVDGEHIYLIDPTTGAITRADHDLALNLPCGDMVAVYATSDELPCDEPVTGTQEMPLADGFTFRRISRMELTEMDLVAHELSEDARPIALGDWRSVAGESFSGAAVYETSFARPDGIGGHFVLDLGDVRHACEVTLNGENLGARIASPYRYLIPAALLQAENTLSVKVTNTSANEYYYTKVFDKWPSWMIAGYVQYQHRYDEDSLPSGLFGPVRLVW
ncbi:MAG: hypothetical protein IKM07_07565, partial [Clostridia bacterium]|nr:hypothetical protein [Clostridia bacterium]